MKIAIISDTHIGCRNDAENFLNLQESFFQKFYKTLHERNIKHIIHAGDLFDRRKYVNYKTLSEAKKFFYYPIIENDLRLHIIPGNHDVYYKNTNATNSIDPFFQGAQDNVNIYHEPCSIKFSDKEIDFVPWITTDNSEQCFEFLKHSKNKILIGHFEIRGFEMFRGITNETGISRKIFEKYDLVLSGHFHHKSFSDNIFYVGAPYQMTWNDYGDVRGFHILDTKTMDMEFIPNDSEIFECLVYDETKDETFELIEKEYTSKYLKLLVANKKNLILFDSFIEKLLKKNPADITIIEEAIFTNESSAETFDGSEDTLTILKQYTEKLRTDLDSNKLVEMLSVLYLDSQGLETT